MIGIRLRYIRNLLDFEITLDLFSTVHWLICLTNARQAGLEHRSEKKDERLYKTFEWIEGEKDDPNKVLDKFELYIHPRKNKRIARHWLFKRKQSSEESFDNFVEDLRLILLDCQYVQSEDVLVDAIIQGEYE